MKALQLFSLLLLFCMQGFLQKQMSNSTPLVGTWMETTDSLQEIKIISPTHVFFYVQNKMRDSFAYAGAGTYTVNQNQYTEHLQHANFELQGGKGTFDYRVQGDTFHQKGVLVMADGTKGNVSHTFMRVKEPKRFEGAHVGTWNQLSSSYTSGDGSKGAHTNATHIRYQIITPTHWMRISKANNNFENAFGGTYTLEGNKMNVKIDYGSIPHIKGATVEITQRVEGNKLYWTGIGKDADGKKNIQFEDVFERVSPTQQTTAAK